MASAYLYHLSQDQLLTEQWFLNSPVTQLGCNAKRGQYNCIVSISINQNHFKMENAVRIVRSSEVASSPSGNSAACGGIPVRCIPPLNFENVTAIRKIYCYIARAWQINEILHAKLHQGIPTRRQILSRYHCSEV